MEFVEKWGTDVDTAVDLALDELKATRDMVDVEILEEPSRGFFGIGSKLALVRVKIKEEPKNQKLKRIHKKNQINRIIQIKMIENPTLKRQSKLRKNIILKMRDLRMKIRLITI